MIKLSDYSLEIMLAVGHMMWPTVCWCPQLRWGCFPFSWFWGVGVCCFISALELFLHYFFPKPFSTFVCLCVCGGANLQFADVRIKKKRFPETITHIHTVCICFMLVLWTYWKVCVCSDSVCQSVHLSYMSPASPSVVWYIQWRGLKETPPPKKQKKNKNQNIFSSYL